MTFSNDDPDWNLPPNAFPIDVPPVDDQPGLGLIWNQPVQPALDDGVRQAEQWLHAETASYLWTAFAVGRQQHPALQDQEAYGIGFLTRLQQHLKRMPH
ncbi:MAG: hypothetical protein GAK44_00173 [Pseudomonas delhiensis]|nr:MAG: hypothetical protein GAK44_00173 [Pseudomonas delhiensis]